MSGDGFARADHRRLFTFPDDHGPHPEYQTEWWYYTGNLETADGRHFGYQLTFFRRAIAPTAAARASQWATNQVYFAHFALTDVKSGAHLATERFSRGAAGLAGASGQPYRVWLEDWEVTSLSADGGRVRLRAEDAGRALDLTLAADKPPVLHGDGGLSPKTNAAGNASYYVSFTRLSTQGTLTSGGQTLTVGGLSWMDHEFGTTSLGPDAVGWDWFAAQLSDWREVMFFQIRQRDGSIEPLSSGTLIEADGTARHLRREDVDVQVSGRWASRATGATYPAGWTLTIPSADLRLTLQPYVPDQEMRVSITYWEGAVVITGQSRGQPVSGSGFVELTGYSGAPPR
ncbi:MAG: carotenoid 1,2-hydratase [Chloroflexi bacterium]|nr:carotenoid 1,2-hydratase [Chloroflexota bacterium]